ncbi:MAG TPA: amylo-alpha-1,6-glucosidase, partial [Bacteroidota bacterium]|nr:amylo-alpha-1,6-glucosidase [Bacteroidota bacterium]
APNAGGWFGWFINAEKILHDYDITLDHRSADRTTSSVTVYPHQTVRRYTSGITETFTMIDSINALLIELTAPSDAKIDLVVSPGEQFLLDSTVALPGRAWKRSASAAGVPSVLLSMPYRVRGGMVFVLSAGSSISQARRQSDSVYAHRTEFRNSRRDRMNRILERGAISTAKPTTLGKAFAWAVLQTDALIMRQNVNGVPTKGIFAGLPWFNNYWGRDSFISLAGATYVIGNFSDAREILRSYARFQETDSTSTNYGRIPNLVTVSSMQYNTADGTPWFVAGVGEYVRATNDTAFYGEMYPVIVRAIEGTLKYHTDSLLFLTHADADTWMDAVGPDGPWSPRGTRANDIQALWWKQLRVSAEIALWNHDTARARSWSMLAQQLARTFNTYFIDSVNGRIYDHLNADGTHSIQERPNELFCLQGLVSAPAMIRRVTNRMLSELVYTHGTSSLAQTDSAFTPYHHYEPYYVQDAAYHNGIVWTWLNGAAIHAATLCNYQDAVYPVTLNMVHQILDRGCVGALSELLDAHVRPGEREPRLSGTYSQAWSLAEFVRSMYEDYLGVRVDARMRKIVLQPHLPVGLSDVTFAVTTPDGMISIRYEKKGTHLLVTPISHATCVYRLVVARGDSSIVVSDVASEIIDPAHRTQARSLSVTLPAPPVRLPRLARPVLLPYLKALKGPSYPLLSVAEAGAKNPSARTLFDAQDSSGDDRGPSPGTYTYPSSVHLKPGSLDITHARIRYDAKHVYVTLVFRRLSDPGWHPEYGFQLTLAAIAIHRSAHDTAIDVGVNSKMRLAPE